MRLKKLWRRISMTGLRDDQEFSHREVVLLNKLIFVATITMVPIIPIEIILNGPEMVPYEIGIIFLSGFAFVLTGMKKFTSAKIYFFTMATLIIALMGTMVGEGSGNELFLVPVFIFPAMMFNDKRIYIPLSAIALIVFLVLKYLQHNVDPLIEIEEVTKTQMSAFFYTTTFVIVFFEIYYFKDINSRFQDLVLNKNAEIEQKNKEIVDSINYAKRIQDAYLPPTNLLAHYFPESFLFFEPKDIVSGDFYWFYAPGYETGNISEVYLVAADCTGHGVPGAIMSVICSNALNDVVVTKCERDTGRILDQVRDNVVKILRDNNQNSRKDGMDLVICRINLSELTVQYSGANNPLWVLRNTSPEMEIIKPDKQPVGYYENMKSFTTHMLSLEKGDQLYFFSDGFQDQFGGNSLTHGKAGGKKFKAANMRKLIEANRTESMDRQRTILKDAFYAWKGDMEQVDDVCVIGVRI